MKLDKAGVSEALHHKTYDANGVAKKTSGWLSRENLRLDERYLLDELRIHIHIRSLVDGGEYCVFFYGADYLGLGTINVCGSELGECWDAGGRNWKLNDRMIDYGEELVLVVVVGLGKWPKVFKPKVLIYEVKDKLHRSLGGTGFLSSNGVYQLVPSFSDRKRWGMPIGLHERRIECREQPQGVERGSEIVNDVSGECSEAQWCGRRDFGKYKFDLPRIVVGLLPDGIAAFLREPVDGRFEIFEKLLGPTGFDCTAGDPICHAHLRKDSSLWRWRSARTLGMRKRSSKAEDVNEAAFRVVQEATGQAPKTDPGAEKKDDGPPKNPAAVALGKLGGAKGGPARAKALSKKRRAEIARKAARARWKR